MLWPCTQADTGAGLRPPGLGAPPLFASAGRCAELGRQSLPTKRIACLMFCVTLVSGVGRWPMKDNSSERREETRYREAALLFRIPVVPGRPCPGLRSYTEL